MTSEQPERMTDERLARYEHDIRKGRWEEDGSLDELLAEARRARAEVEALKAAGSGREQDTNLVSQYLWAHPWDEIAARNVIAHALAVYKPHSPEYRAYLAEVIRELEVEMVASRDREGSRKARTLPHTGVWGANRPHRPGGGS